MLISYLSFAQVSQNVAPAYDLNSIPNASNWISVNTPDTEALIKQDLQEDADKSVPYRFGEPIVVDANIMVGEPFETENGWVWKLGISAPGARSLNFNFNEFRLPEGAQLRIYNFYDREDFLGPFTTANNKVDGQFSTFLLFSDKVILAYYLPKSATDSGSVKMGSVVYGYREFPSSPSIFGESGNCNVNVICPEGNNWRDQIKSVVMILAANNSRICSGTLVNNTSEDGTPYVLTANHCPIATNNVFVFNYDSPTCSPPTDGPTNFTISGCDIKSNNSSFAASDFKLLELSSTPPASYNVYYSGWSNINVAPQSSTCIHHPKGDVKKISVDYEPATHSGYYSRGSTYWRIEKWNKGTTENASSGAGLFDQKKRIIGQLHGGEASCTVDSMDFFGKFSHSWDAQSDSISQLKYWLDPTNSGSNIVDGMDPNISSASLDAQITGIIGLEVYQCGDSAFPIVVLKNKGTSALSSADLTLYLNGNMVLTQPWTGNLSQYNMEKVQLPGIELSTASNELKIEVSNPNGGTDMVPSNDVFSYSFISVAEPIEVELIVRTDDDGDESSWELTSSTGSNLYSFGSYPSVPGGALYTDTFCLYDGCFNFSFYDSFGDGICCDFGNGFYLMRNTQTGDTIFFDNGFDQADTNHVFCLGDSCTLLNSGFITHASDAQSSDGKIRVEMLSGTPPFSFSWSNGETGAEIIDLAPGLYGVSITDSLGCTDSAYYEVEIGTSVSDYSDIAEFDVNIYPNPANDNITISWNSTIRMEQIEMFNVHGKRVRLIQQFESSMLTENVGSLESGMYIVVLKTENGVNVNKLIISR